jgi:hypothetical protein
VDRQRVPLHAQLQHLSLQALQDHGAVAGSYLTVRRLARCHPWCEGGHDPVPADVPGLFTRWVARRLPRHAIAFRLFLFHLPREDSSMTDIRRTLLWVVFSMSLVLIWDAWQKHNGNPSMFSPQTPGPPLHRPAAGSCTGCSAAPGQCRRVRRGGGQRRAGCRAGGGSGRKGGGDHRPAAR